MSDFNDINVAYNKLMAMQAEVEDRENSDEIEYEALIEKVLRLNYTGGCMSDKYRVQKVLDLVY